MKIVKIVGAAGGTKTPHDGRWLVAWNADVAAGVCAVESAADKGLARRGSAEEFMTEWKAISRVQPIRPWDHKPNRPLTALTILIEDD